MSGQLWTPTREWDGETCFIVAGGPSASQHDLQRLRGHKTIVVNSSFWKVPFADFLIFADTRWWDAYHKEFLKIFGGRIVSASSLCRHPRLLRVKRKLPPGLATDPAFVLVKYTTVTCAINLAVHLGARKIVLVGVDGKNDGERTHHHSDHPHRWKQKPGTFDKQRRDFGPVAKDLRTLGIECVNASPGSALADLWPIVDFGAMIDEDDARIANKPTPVVFEEVSVQQAQQAQAQL